MGRRFAEGSTKGGRVGRERRGERRGVVGERRGAVGERGGGRERRWERGGWREERGEGREGERRGERREEGQLRRPGASVHAGRFGVDESRAGKGREPREVDVALSPRVRAGHVPW